MIPEFQIVYSPRRRRISFAVHPEDGRLEVRAPIGISSTEIARIVKANWELAEKLQQRARRLLVQHPPKLFLSGEEFYYLGVPYPLEFSRRIRQFERAFLIPGGTPDEVKKQLELLFRQLAQEYLPDRVQLLANRYRLNPGEVKINGARRRWGSCNRNGTLNFTWRLIQAPPEAVDYVIVHELAHLRELNHSPRFWDEVRRMLPDYELHQQHLTQYARRYDW